VADYRKNNSESAMTLEQRSWLW